MRILIVDADARTADRLSFELTGLSHECTVAADGRAGLSVATKDAFDAVLIEMQLPHVDGIGVVLQLRDRGIDIPIVMLTASGDLDQRLAGLDAGADDYVIKPAAPTEIDARLRAIRRRAARSTGSGVMRVGDIVVNEVRYRVTRAGRPIVLKKLEFKLLCELARNANAVVTRQMLYRTVWKYDAEPTTNIAESYVRYLRGRLNGPGERDPIVTVRGVGYMLTG